MCLGFRIPNATCVFVGQQPVPQRGPLGAVSTAMQSCGIHTGAEQTKAEWQRTRAKGLAVQRPMYVHLKSASYFGPLYIS